MARFTASVVLPTPPFTFPREIIMLISPRYKMLSFHIIEDILSICKGNQNIVCCGERGIEDIQIFRSNQNGIQIMHYPQSYFLISSRYKILSFHIIEDILSIC